MGSYGKLMVLAFSVEKLEVRFAGWKKRMYFHELSLH